MADEDHQEPVIETPNLSIRKKKRVYKGWPKGKPRKGNLTVAQLDEINRRIDAQGELTEEDKTAARERARAHVLKKRKEKALDAYFDAAVKAQEQALEPNQAIEDFTVDLPEYTYHITINGQMFYHGVTYRIGYNQARSMADIQARAWEHQREIDGRRRMADTNRRPEQQIISPTRPGRVSSSGNMRI